MANGETTSDPERIEYDVYLRERESLYRHQQDTEQAYSKTILTLSASLIAFSAAFLSLTERLGSGGESTSLVCMSALVWCWGLLGLAVLLVLAGLAVGAWSFDIEIGRLEDALEDASVLESTNKAAVGSRVLGYFAGAAFIMGLGMLIRFCAVNLSAQ